MVTSHYNGQYNYYETSMNYKSNDNYMIILSNKPDSPMVFGFDLFTLEIKDIIGMTKVKLILSFNHLIQFMISALDSIDYADPQIMNIPSQNPYESYSIVFDFIDEMNIQLEIYLRNPIQSILVSDILFDQESLTNLVNTILNDYLERNHSIEALTQMKKSGILWS